MCPMFILLGTDTGNMNFACILLAARLNFASRAFEGKGDEDPKITHHLSTDCQWRHNPAIPTAPPRLVCHDEAFHLQCMRLQALFLTTKTFFYADNCLTDPTNRTRSTPFLDADPPKYHTSVFFRDEKLSNGADSCRAELRLPCWRQPKP